MCGIFGHYLFRSTNSKDVLQTRFLSAQRALRHRGPDDSGLETFQITSDPELPVSTISLGHTRLSIIDLTPGGHQPMHSSNGHYTIVFNGEIYNYRELRTELESTGYIFHTDSDSEVLLTAWAHHGIAVLRLLIGMFAFAVYNRQDDSLTLVRDAFGIKPLYYSHDENSFSFASEVPALLALLPRKPDLDLQQAYNYLVFGRYDDQAATFYKGVSHLQPGHWLRLDLKSMELTGPASWWQPSINERTDISFNEATQQLRELFLKNIRLHLRSDVPIGAALSGGIDSSAIVCAMRYLEPDLPIHTFSFIAPSSEVNEEPWIDKINDYVGAIPHKSIVSPSELGEDLDDLIQGQTEPFGSTSIYAQYRVFQLARESGIIVSLDGQGADELLAGYNGYPSAYIHSLLDQHRYLEIARFLHRWVRWPGRNYRNGLLMLIQPLVPESLRGLAYKIVGRSPTPHWINTKYLAQQGVRLTPPLLPDSPPEVKGRRLAAALRNALTGEGLAALLRHGDRNSMYWSIESRVPFLTIEIAEFLLQLPESYLLGPDGQTKRIFRAAMRGLVPDEILDRRDKIGFQTPEKNWISDIRNKIQGWLFTTNFCPFLKVEESRKEICLILEGRKRFGPQAWRLINFCRWVELSK